MTAHTIESIIFWLTVPEHEVSPGEVDKPSVIPL